MLTLISIILLIKSYKTSCTVDLKTLPAINSPIYMTYPPGLPSQGFQKNISDETVHSSCQEIFQQAQFSMLNSLDEQLFSWLYFQLVILLVMSFCSQTV